MIDSSTWELLESATKGHGTSQIRLHPASSQDIFLAVAEPNARRRLLVEVDSDAVTTTGFSRQTKAVRLVVESLGTSRSALVIELVDRTLEPVFDPLVSDIADCIAGLVGTDGVAAYMVDRFEFWRNLLRDLQEGSLGALRRRGLYGELSCFREFVLPSRGNRGEGDCYEGAAITRDNE